MPVAAATGAFDTLTAAKYAQITAPLTRMRLAGATSITFLVPASDAQIPAVQALWRTRGVPDLQLKPGPGGEHIFSILSLRAARSSGQVAVTDAFQFRIDQDLPVAQRQLSFALAAPVTAALTHRHAVPDNRVACVPVLRRTGTFR